MTVQDELSDFRAEVVEFIRDELPPELKNVRSIRSVFDADEAAFAENPQDLEPLEVKEARKKWRHSLLRKGWLAPGWPVEYGGGGLGTAHQFIFNEEMINHDAPRYFDMGLAMIGPTIVSYGTEEQRRRMLPPILTGEAYWCELFSEPSAGSDLARLRTRAVRDGDEYVVNGQKIWTTEAQKSDYGLLMARTDSESTTYRGISMFRVNMRAPGVTVRHIQNLTGHRFNEVFFDNVRIPAEDLIGEENGGFYYLMSLLDTERSAISQVAVFERTLDSLFNLARSGAVAPLTKATRTELVNRAIELEVMRGLSQGVADLQFRGRKPAYEASVLKLFHTELAQRIAATGMRMIGTDGLLAHGEASAPLRGTISQHYLYSSTLTIQVGTSEIQRNIIATRGLGFPRS